MYIFALFTTSFYNLVAHLVGFTLFLELGHSSLIVWLSTAQLFLSELHSETNSP